MTFSEHDLEVVKVINSLTVGEEIPKINKEELVSKIDSNDFQIKKYSKIINSNDISKNILFGYKDGKLGQLGFKGSKNKIQLIDVPKLKFRWTWSIKNTGKFIKCLIMKDDSYIA